MRRGLRGGWDRPHKTASNLRWDRKSCGYVGWCYALRDLDFAVAGRPKAQRQAHERIIGGRLVANSQKILSLYEPDVRVIVRGKADAEVEFGDTVLVAEHAQGIILDYQVWREPAPADVNLPLESLERLKEVLGCTVGAVVTDRR